MVIMKAYTYILLVFGTLLLLSCGSTSKVSYTQEQLTSFTNFLDTKSYKFLADTANPTMTNGVTAVAMSGLWPPGGTFSSISLQGNNNYMTVKGDSILADLPYFGERQMGGGYGNNTGITFKGIPSRYKEEFDASKNEMRIVFTISDKLETYQVTLSAFPNKKATLIVNSTQRFPIRYLGELKELEAEASVSR